MDVFELTDTVSFLLESQAGFIEPYDDCGDGALCFGAALNSVTAAYATVGYWMQADLLQYVKLTNLGAWAPLIYILAAFGGLFSMAMGQPPRNWMWFFVGPGVYWWLIDSSVQVDAVSWRVGNVQMDQRVVWEKAETALKNSPLFQSAGGRVRVYKNKKPDNPVIVAMPFLWYDALISSTVQAMVSWTGVHRQENQTGDAANSNLTNEAQTEGKPWFILSTLKWQYLQDITAARLANVDARDLTARFFTNGCGDKLALGIEPGLYLAATNSKGAGLPDTVFKDGGPAGQFQTLKIALAEEWVPLPRSLRNIFSDTSDTGFRRSLNFEDKVKQILSLDRIRCDTYLDLLIYYFRWESGGIYEQAFTNTTPPGLDRGDVAYNLLYGWDIKMGRDGGGAGAGLNSDQQQFFIKDLILLHLIRNELALVPKPIVAGTTESELTAVRAESATRTTGSVAKYGEVYTWATMIPHAQGIIIMLLTMAYPFVAMIVLVPGMHGFMFTWMRYFAWAKIWDLGFALVTIIERSVWSSLSTGTDAIRINDKVVDMQEIGSVKYLDCIKENPNPDAKSCYSPLLEIQNGGGAAQPDGSGYDTNLELLDIALTVGSNLDLDLANGYYIYLMAALYFAVPAVTAQVLMVQGANFVDNMTSEISQGAGRGAQTGYSGTLTQRVMSNKATADQASRGKAFRASGLAHQAMSYENRAAEMQLDGGINDQAASGLGRFSDVSQLSRNIGDYQRNLGFAVAKAKLGGTRGNPEQQISTGTAGTGQNKTGQAGTGPEQDAVDSNGNVISGPQSDFAAINSMGGLGDDAAGNVLDQMGYNGKRPKLGDAYQAITTAGMLDLASQAGTTNAFTQAAVFEMGNKAQAGAHGIASFHSQNAGGMYRNHSERLMAQAEFEAGQAQYDMMNHFADQLTSDTMIAGSANIGSLDPGQRPMDMRGMAMSGMLNTRSHNTRRAANYFNPTNGAYGQKLRGATENLRQNYGYGKTMGMFRVSNSGFEVLDSFRAITAEGKRATFTGRRSGLGEMK